MQASWLTTDDERRLYLGGSRLVLGLIGGLLMGLSAGLMGGLIVGLIGGLIGGLLMLRQAWSGSITTGLSYRWSWNKVRSAPRVGWGAVLILLLAWGLLSGPRDVGPMVRPFRWLFDNLSLVLPSVFLGILFQGLTASEIEERASPNQGMWQLAKSCLLFGLSIALISQLALRLARWLLSEPGDDRLVLTLLSSLISGLWLALALGGTSFVQHFILRSVLYRSGHMSWNCVRFLDFAVGRILLHRVGGGYVFIHKLLQEHFVGLGIVMGLTTKEEQASVLCGQGRMAEDEQDYAEARCRYTESLEISTEAGYQVGVADALRGLGRIAEAQKDYGEAQSRYREFLEISREAKDRAGIADALQRLGRVAEVGEDYAEARRLYRESLDINERLRGREATVVALGVRLGSIAEMEGDYAEARRRFRKFLELSREVESQAGMAAALHALGNIAGAEGRYAEAGRLYRESLEHDDGLKFQEDIARRLYDWGLTFYDQGEYDESGRLFQHSLEIYEKLENRAGVATTLGSLGMSAYGRREYAEAGRLLQRSLKIYEKLENQEGIAVSLLRLGWIAAVQGDDDQARSLYQRSHEIFERLQSPYAEAARGYLAELDENGTSSHDT